VSTFRVYGTPIPQGSMRGFVSRGAGKARVILTSANTKLEPWRQDVAAQAIKAGVEIIPSGPVQLRVVFYLPHPVSRPKKYKWPDVRPDLDKLVRGILDSLSSIAFRDDGQVCELSATKVYTDFVGADITVQPL
jgi:Holliday junction resolvase RusA-like endonuclease